MITQQEIELLRLYDALSPSMQDAFVFALRVASICNGENTNEKND